jgi:hypothetical protein
MSELSGPSITLAVLGVADAGIDNARGLSDGKCISRWMIYKVYSRFDKAWILLITAI